MTRSRLRRIALPARSRARSGAEMMRGERSFNYKPLAVTRTANAEMSLGAARFGRRKPVPHPGPPRPSLDEGDICIEGALAKWRNLESLLRVRNVRVASRHLNPWPLF